MFTKKSLNKVFLDTTTSVLTLFLKKHKTKTTDTIIPFNLPILLALPQKACQAVHPFKELQGCGMEETVPIHPALKQVFLIKSLCL